MSQKRRREESPEFNEHDMKFAGAKASAGVVSIITHDVLEEMIEKHGKDIYLGAKKEIIFYASGIIIECRQSSSSKRKYLCTVLAPASLFSRPNHDTIKIDVFGAGGVLYNNAKLLASDFHYNLAAISFKSPSPLQNVTFKHLDDTFSIHPTHHFPDMDMPFQFPPHSNFFNILPGTELFSLSRSHVHPYGLYPASGFFSSRCPQGFSCGELYEIKDSIYCPVFDGGSVLNAFGETIGIIFNRSSFLPSNVMTRWWNHHKKFKKLCWNWKFESHTVVTIRGAVVVMVGGRLAMSWIWSGSYNPDPHTLSDIYLNFLEQIITGFPNISTAVIITKVEEDSRASDSGFRANDVIIKLDGKLVKSKSKFFETIWEKAGKSVEFSILRVSDGEELDLNLTIEEANLDKFHKWPVPGWDALD
ncbi:hypothetical protein KSS87_018076 [Heliosperma pusillum]|nr:hypothetical protein KSS87_018076 [Heliosperma pusillum]